MPHALLSTLEQYFRLEVEGEENIPAGGAILLPNHSGYLGLDALLLNHWILKNQKRLPRILLHRFWFTQNLLRSHAEKFGFLEASYDNGVGILNKRKLLIMFPEAEQGNFKTINKKYQLQNFRTGFVRMASETRVPVVPIVIIGAEETHINVGQISILGQLFPLPLNSIPLPAKWKIKFLKPIYFDVSKSTSFDIQETANKVKALMQDVLKKELGKRRYIYFSI
ncbi:lysophospholipid acyltransferase family protein [Bdellovibrio bacteriovorus]|uniref:lysophospholipid acyltransferase family protein n=1 Tax=Bdellovibrio TaxID=958 RepID=UPI0035A8C672